MLRGNRSIRHSRHKSKVCVLAQSHDGDSDLVVPGRTGAGLQEAVPDEFEEAEEDGDEDDGGSDDSGPVQEAKKRK
jgi:hypothetical protein